jgi:hypothetical protein
MSDHSRYAPSHLHRVKSCPGYLSLLDEADSLEGRSSDASEEGTAAHWVASEALHGRFYVEGDLTPEGHAITQEMIEGAEMWADALAPYRQPDEAIEEKRAIPGIHIDCFGTADYDWKEPKDGLLIVADYKFGHKYVEVFENEQLTAYASSRCTSYLPTVNIKFIIVQPRSYCTDGPVRDWSCSMKRLGELRDELAAACRDSDDPEAECATSSACYCCPVRHQCRAALSTEQASLDMADMSAPLNASLADQTLRLQQVLRGLDHLEQMRTGLEEVISKAIKVGEPVDAFELKSSIGRLGWKAETEKVIQFGDMMGVDLRKMSVITPTQAIKAGVPEDLLAGVAARNSGTPKLVPTNLTNLRKVFGS